MRSTVKWLLSLLMFSCLIIFCCSTIYFERHKPKPGHENECYDAENGVYYQKGELMIWNKKYCGQKICKGSDEKRRIYIEYHGCGKANIPPGCYLDVNSELPYPKCCGKIKCSKKEN